MNEKVEIIEFDFGNYDGRLRVKLDGGKAYWSCDDWGGPQWSEIPMELYHALVKHGPRPRTSAKENCDG